MIGIIEEKTKQVSTMLPMELRKKVIEDYEDGMPVRLISQVMRVRQSAIYRLDPVVVKPFCNS